MKSHDKTLKDLFDERELVASVVRTFREQLGLSPEDLARLDFDTIEEVPTEFRIRKRRVRLADRARRILLRATPDEDARWLYLLFEFQGRSDRYMFSRMMEYEGGFLRIVQRAEKLKSGELHPQVVSTVVNHGREPWTGLTQGRKFYYHLIDIPSIDLSKLPDGELASWWIRCERAQTKEEALAALSRAFDIAAREEDDSLRRALHARVAELSEWEDFPSYEQCEAKWRGEDSMASALAENIREWCEAEQAKGRAKGLAEGLAEGRVEGLAAQRALLCEQAAQRFDETISGQLSDLLSRIDDFERLTEIGRSIIACETGEELLSQVNGSKVKPRRNGKLSD